MSTRESLGLVLSVAVCLGVGAVSAIATSASVSTWYARIAKPAWTPPDVVFGPVWTVLYVSMGVAAWLLWRTASRPDARGPLALFALQLLLNGAWPFIFFGLRRPGWAAVEIFLLWAAIVATMLAFRRVSRLASWLLAPYLAWVSFAVALNLAIWALNR